MSDVGVRADLLNDDGTLTYADAVQLLTNVAGRGPVTGAEFSSLQTIAANLNNGLSASAYVATAFMQIVDGSPANATWNGGSETAVPLGNLEVGSTSTQLSELIGKWLLGTDLPDPTLPSGSAYSSPTYTAVAGPLYGSTGAASIEDICQGADGDCELLSGLADEVVNHPQLLSSMIVANGNGTYGIRFYVNGNGIWETVNDELPTASGELVNAHNFDSQNSALWAALIEKAYAQLSATGLIDHPAVNSYNNVWADPPTTVLENVTDCTDVTYYLSSSAEWYSDKTIFLNALAGDDDIVLEIPASGSDTYDNAGNTELAADHAFAVIGYDSATGDFVVRNPWGDSYSGQGWDPQFEVSLAQIAADDGDLVVDNSGTHGSTIVITALPQEILSSRSPIAGLFRVTNSTGASITQYRLQAVGAVSVQLNGAVNVATAAETAQGQVVISASDLSKITLSGSASGTGELFVSASDGSSWSAATDIPLTVSAGAALTQPLDLAIAPGATVSLSSLFNVSGSLGANAAVEVNLPDGNGSLNLNGATDISTDLTVVMVWATQLPLVTYTAPASGGTAQIQLIVNNGAVWSPWLTENLTLDGVRTAAVAVQDYENGQFAEASHVVDTAAHIFANLDTLQDAFAAGALQTIALSDTTPQMEALSAYHYSRDRGVLSILSGNYSIRNVDLAAAPPNFFNNVAEAGILWRNASTGGVELWNPNGSGGFTYESLNPVSPSWQIAGTGDFNGSGEAGILWRNSNGGVELWNSNGSGGFTYDNLGSVNTSWQVAGTGDFSGTGETGILWRNTKGGAELWNPNGSDGFTYDNLGSVNTSWQVAGTGDFTGTGGDGVLWRNATNGDVELWNPNGSGGFAYDNLGAVSSSWQIAGTGDFTGSGQDSILWRNTNGDTELWNPNGSGGFTYQDLGVVNTSWQVAETGDFTGSGQSGILWRNTSGATELWNPNGSGGFTYQDLSAVATNWTVQKIFA